MILWRCLVDFRWCLVDLSGCLWMFDDYLYSRFIWWVICWLSGGFWGSVLFVFDWLWLREQNLCAKMIREYLRKPTEGKKHDLPSRSIATPQWILVLLNCWAISTSVVWSQPTGSEGPSLSSFSWPAKQIGGIKNRSLSARSCSLDQ